MSEIKAVVFDIDGTLSSEVSWLALTKGLGASVDEHVRIYRDYKQGTINYSESKHRLIGIWQDTGNANKNFSQQLFESWPLDPAAPRTAGQALEKYAVCLITGSMDAYAQVVAKKLEIPKWYANTTLKWNSEGELVDMDYELNQAKKKAEQFAAFCSENNLQPSECIVVGDGENDMELFKMSGKGVLILGDEKADEYRQYAWRVAATLADLEHILKRTNAID